MPKHRGVISDIIAEKNLKIVAEIGVNYGRLIERVFANQHNRKTLKEYWAVDPWALYSGHLPGTKEEWNEMHKSVCGIMTRYKQLRVLKLTSVRAASLFPDKYFDFVYIDANHTYKAVYADIYVWLPKVRDGGILGGHDFHYKGVRQAISEILGVISEPQTRWKKYSKVWIKDI